MWAKVSFFVGIVVSAGVPATPAMSEELIYSPWTKFCLSDVCFVVKDARTASDCVPRFGAALIEQTGETKNTLRVTVPASADHARGVRIGIDRDGPIERPYGRCDAKVCSADLDGGVELIARLKLRGKLIFDTVGASGGPIHFELPLSDFAAAYDGPPQKPKAFEAQSEKLQEELKARADAERIRCGAN